MFSFDSVAQCANDNALTGSAITPPCPGTTTVSCVQGGQYVLVNVTLGNTYTFSTCAAFWDTQITLYNNTGGLSLGYNDDACGLQSTVTWIATFTGQLRVLVDQYFCTSNSSCAPLDITCTAPPSGDCIYELTLYDSFSDGWGTSFVGVSINGSPYTNYTLPPGAPSLTIQIGVYIGDVLTLFYDASGTWQTDNSYALTLGGGGAFNSGTPPVAGISYTVTVDCVPPPAAQEDCIGATTVCNNLSFSNNTNNTGSVVDIDVSNSGCLDIVEYQGTWYMFSPSTGGNIGFTIAPQGPDDYDWAVWGPYPPGSTSASICPPAGPPIRCAASSGPATFNSTGSYATGMGHSTYSPPQFAGTGTTYSIPATTNICPLILPQYCGWVPGIQVTAGEVYLVYISNWSQSNTAFDLTWTLGGGASLDCIVLPIELLRFDAELNGDQVDLRWSTASESNSNYFGIERSSDGSEFEAIGTVQAAGNSYQTIDYTFTDHSPHKGLNYYRLHQVDNDGEFEYSPIRSVTVLLNSSVFQLVPNPGQDVVELVSNSFAPGSIFTMHDAIGREVLQVPLMDGRMSIDVYDLPSGLYTYRVNLPSGTISGTGKWIRE